MAPSASRVSNSRVVSQRAEVLSTSLMSEQDATDSHVGKNNPAGPPSIPRRSHVGNSYASAVCSWFATFFKWIAKDHRKADRRRRIAIADKSRHFAESRQRFPFLRHDRQLDSRPMEHGRPRSAGNNRFQRKAGYRQLCKKKCKWRVDANQSFRFRVLRAWLARRVGCAARAVIRQRPSHSKAAHF